MPRISGHDLCMKKAWYFWFPTSQAESFPWLQESTQSTIPYSRKSNSKFAFYLSQIHPKCWSTFFQVYVCTRTFQGERDWKPTFGKNANFQLGLEYLKRSFWHGSYYRSPILSYGQSRSTACLTFQIIVSTGGYPISKSIRTLIWELADRKLTD